MKCICGKDIISGAFKCAYCKRVYAQIDQERADKRNPYDTVNAQLDCEIMLLKRENDFIENEIELSNRQIQDYIESLNRANEKLEAVKRTASTKNVLYMLLDEFEPPATSAAGYKIRAAVERQLKDFYKLEVATKNGEVQQKFDKDYNKVDAVTRNGSKIFLNVNDFVLNLDGRFICALLSSKAVKKELIYDEAQKCSAKWRQLNLFVHNSGDTEKKILQDFGEVDDQATALKEYYKYFLKLKLIYQ